MTCGGLLTGLHVCPEFPYQPALCDSLAVLVKSMILSPLFFCPNPASFMNDYLVKKPVDLHRYLYQIQILVQFVIVNMDQDMYLPYFGKNSDDECI